MELARTIDEINIGDMASYTKTITETDLTLYAGITGDFNPLHMNEEYAKKTIFKGRIAHGTIPMGLFAPAVLRLTGLGTILREVTARFVAPVRIGDTVTALLKVVEKIEEKNMVKATIVWTNQRGEKVIEGSVTVMPITRKLREQLLK